MKNNLDNKRLFFTQYWGQDLVCDKDIKFFGVEESLQSFDKYFDSHYLKLKPLSKIKKDDLIEVLRLAHNLKNVNPKDITIKETEHNDAVHCSYYNSGMNGEYHICLNYNYATINSNLHFHKTEDENTSSHSVNIGKIHHSANYVVGYIQIVDFLRSKGYLMPWRDLSIKKLIEYKWVKI